MNEHSAEFDQPSEAAIRAVYDRRGEYDRRSYEAFREGLLHAWWAERGVEFEAPRAVLAAVRALAKEWENAVEPDGSTSLAPVRWMAVELLAVLSTPPGETS